MDFKGCSFNMISKIPCENVYLSNGKYVETNKSPKIMW